ncbi:Uncharacterised protein [Klebsiella pneumoniae]|nr:Uncharacterised protein [Klebsiella pneumoniae]
MLNYQPPILSFLVIIFLFYANVLVVYQNINGI